ncbi:hypothetical protein GCM10009841_31610 [Microlunatus panaciterrae]
MTAIGAVLAATSAASQVPEILLLRCTDTTSAYPRSANPSYMILNASGEGRDVLTRFLARSARATSAGVTDSSDSGRLMPSMTTCRGTTPTPARSARNDPSDAVESVTTATPAMAQE